MTLIRWIVIVALIFAGVAIAWGWKYVDMMRSMFALMMRLSDMFACMAAPQNWNDFVSGVKKDASQIGEQLKKTCGSVLCGEDTSFVYYECCDIGQCCMYLTTLSYVLIALAVILAVVALAVCGFICCCWCC